MKLVILDRDGVINQDSDTYIKAIDEWVPIPGSLEAIAALSKAGYLVFVATNQSGLGRGMFSEIDLANIHQKMISLVEALGGRIDGVFYCPHLPAENCACRKPKIGMLDAIAMEFNVKLVGAPFIGDSLKDVQAAKAAGCTPMLVRTGKGLDTIKTARPADLAGVSVFDDLGAAADYVLGNPR
ncbi:MAG: D-glycero-beta-D-manno-heptose 1,7-bisphosphate 7-phosphatase [Pseudohongiellaceae bacterium]